MSNIITDLDTKLKELILKSLQGGFPGETWADSDITSDSPAEIQNTSPTKPMVSVFLYQIVENSELKNRPPDVIDNKKQSPPLYLDLYYLITAYAKDKDNERRVLEEIMTLFHDQRIFSLASGGNERIKIILHNFSFEEVNKLWERFPNKPYKLSVAYQLTPVRVPSGKEAEPVSRIIEKTINMYAIQ